MNKTKIILFCFKSLLLVLPFSSFSQDLYSTINGLVRNDQNMPLPFASVYAKDTHFGTITNEDGRFTIKLPAGTNELTASFMGYKTSSITISHSPKELVITLEENSIQLKEVIITSFTPELLFKKAVEMIPLNYPMTPVTLHTFFREKLFVNDSLEYFAEAAYSIEKSYKKSNIDKNYIDRTRSFRFYKDTSLKVILLGGWVNDLINYIGNNFEKSLLKNHNLTLDSPVVIDDRKAYAVRITPKSDYKNNAISGYYYIDMQTFAFLKIEVKCIHRNPNIYNDQIQSYDAHYRFIGEKCYPVFLATMVEKYFLRNGIVHKANSFCVSVITSIDTMVDKNNKNKTLFNKGNSLENYPTNYDTSFWNEYISILPDKETEHELESYKQHKNDTIIPLSLNTEQTKTANPKIVPELYHPNISFFLSNQTPNNLVAFNETYMSVNSLINYFMMKKIKSFKYAGTLSSVFSMVLSIPFQSVEAERQLLAKNKIKANYNPTVFNSLFSSFCFGVSDFEMSNFKNTNYADFMRLHTVRKDANYLSIKSIEEKIVLADLSNDRVKRDYFKNYYFELFIRKFSYSIYYFPNYNFYSDDNSKSESKKAIIIDNPKSFVKYLFNPTDNFKRYVSKSDLTNEESNFLTKSAYFSFLNLLSLQTFGIKPLRLCNDKRFTFSLSYLLVPFGEMYEQNIWVYSKRNTIGLFLRQYKNYSSLGAGFGLKFYNLKITEKIICQTSIDYWYQPEKQLFYDNHFIHGFGINQTFESKLKEDSFNHNGDLSLYVGYDFKTKGYQPQNLNMKQDISIFCGIKYNFNKY